jgi:hypothetical protein
MSFHFMSFHVMSFHVISCHFMSFHVISCHYMSFHVISRHFMSYQVILCHFKCHCTFPQCHSKKLGGVMGGRVGQICLLKPWATASLSGQRQIHSYPVSYALYAATHSHLALIHVWYQTSVVYMVSLGRHTGCLIKTSSVVAIHVLWFP